jgi:lipopolysaccharide export system protein LptA
MRVFCKTMLIAWMITTGVAHAQTGATSGQAARSGGAVLPGGNSKQPINIQATKLDYFDKEQKLIYTGNVLAVQGDSKLKCSVLVIYLPPKAEGQASTPSSSSQVRRMEAAGPVTMVSKDQVGTGNSGVYDKMSDTVVLTGDVTLSQGPNVTKGDQLVYDLKTGQAKVTGKHVVSVFLPSNADDTTTKVDPRPKKTAPPKHGSRPETATQ